MLAIGTGEIDRMPVLGKTVVCWICGKRHKVKFGNEILPDGTKKLSQLLAFFSCKGQEYLCGVNGNEFRPEKKRGGYEKKR